MASSSDCHTADPAWTLSYDSYDPGDEGRREAILAVGNGIFVTRAAAAQAREDDVHYPGTYRAGCYDLANSCVAGRQDSSASLVNLPNWLPLNFRFEGGNWFSLDEVDRVEYNHSLDLRAGVAHRRCTFVDAAGRQTQLHEQRLVSMAVPHVAAQKLAITPLNWSGSLEVVAEIDGRVINNNVPRYADYERRHLDVTGTGGNQQDLIWLTARTRRSCVLIVQAARATVVGKTGYALEKQPDRVGLRACCSVTQGRTQVVEKQVALVTSADPDVTDPEASAAAVLEDAGGYEQLRRAHEDAWQLLWQRVAIAADHAPTALALRFHAFHILQTVSPHTAGLDVGVPARGWHGEGYRGHVFWDELFVFPFLNFRFPELARSLLLYRYRRLDEARAAAKAAGYSGAMYPWRSGPDGRETTPRLQKNLISGHWMRDPTRLQRHIGSAVARNIWNYYLATGDDCFLADYGAEMILEIARFWASIAVYSHDHDRYEIRDVLGPDEYHNSYPDRAGAGLDNNAYTNVMAVWSLCRGLEVLNQLSAERKQELIEKLHLTEAEFQRWDSVSRKMRVVFHGHNIISQYEGFDRLREFDPAQLPASLRDRRVDWALEAVGETADKYQVTKQADTLTLFYLLSPREINAIFNRIGYRFDREDLARTADYYLERTTHRSSLSRITYAGALALVNPALSWQLYQQALGTDLHALKGESIAEGIHLGAMGGTLDVLQRHYMGIEPRLDGLHIAPALPEELSGVRLGLHYRGLLLEVEACASYVAVRAGADNAATLKIAHASGCEQLAPGAELRLPRRSAGMELDDQQAVGSLRRAY